MIYLIKAFVSVFGIGYIRIAPVSFGSLFAILLWYISINYLNIYFFYAILIIVFIFSFKAINIYLKNENKDDPPEVVVDEFSGQLIATSIASASPFVNILTLLLFRFFDIKKHTYR